MRKSSYMHKGEAMVQGRPETSYENLFTVTATNALTEKGWGMWSVYSNSKSEILRLVWKLLKLLLKRMRYSIH